MPAELMVINPIRRKKRRTLSAKQRKYFGPKRRKSKRTYARRNPVSVASFGSPVRKTRRRRYGRRVASKARSYYRRRSAGRGFGGFFTSTIIPAAVGGAGALLLDMAWGKLPIPDALKSGPAAPIARIALAVGVGYGVGMVAGKKYGNEAMAGALIVTAYDLIKNLVVPSIPVAAVAPAAAASQVGYYSAAKGAGMGMYVNDGMGLYLPN